MKPTDLAAVKNDAGVCILDIREPYEIEICSITALSIPMGEVVNRLSEIPRDKHIVVMCKTGRRAEAVANLLATEYNYTDVSVLEGGIIAWIESVDNHLESY